MTAPAAWDPPDFRRRLQAQLDTFVEEQQRRLEPLGPDARILVGAAREAVSGGKRLRALFCHWGFHAVRPAGDPGEQARLMRACAAVEMLHGSALIHDDVMDASDTRRGKPSVHRAFEARHREAGWRGDAQQYGEAAAILLGDLLLVWSDEQLRTSGFDQQTVLEALRVFDTTRSEVVTGQFLDVSVQARGDADVEQSMRVVRYKSAKYSIERPLHLGCVLAGGREEQRAALSAYGVPLGEAFQLRDDLLGVFGDPGVTGKPAGDDLTEGKRTVLVALAMRSLSEADRAMLDKSLGCDLAPEEITELQRRIRACGAEDQVESHINDLTARAVTALENPGLDAGARESLRQLAAAATQRVV